MFFLCGTKYWEHSIGLCYSVIAIYFILNLISIKLPFLSSFAQPWPRILLLDAIWIIPTPDTFWFFKQNILNQSCYHQSFFFFAPLNVSAENNWLELANLGFWCLWKVLVDKTGHASYCNWKGSKICFYLWIPI